MRSLEEHNASVCANRNDDPPDGEEFECKECGDRVSEDGALCEECQSNQEDCDSDAWSGGFAENH